MNNLNFATAPTRAAFLCIAFVAFASNSQAEPTEAEASTQIASQPGQNKPSVCRRGHRNCRPGSKYEAYPAHSARGNLIANASRYIGSRNPTGFRGPWCAAFLNMTLRQSGYRAGRSNRARDAIQLGSRIQGPVPGAIAVMRNHTGIVLGATNGKVTLLSGNYSGKVSISEYRQTGIVFVQPEKL